MIIDDAIFLLGGKDLEMVEIKRVLDTHKIKYYDENLSWGARLSDYQHKLNKFTTYYAVELEIDLVGYDNIKIIDHHGNTHNHKESSLLQILKLLDMTPTRDQQLIAANDTRYIKGMKCLGATECEIEDIRKRDRKAQGVTHNDEISAKNDARSKKIENNIACICATTAYFSAITDSLYFFEDWKEKTIISNDVTMIFYGFPVSVLENVCQKYNIKEHDYYFGGGVNGYFGIKENCVDKKVKEKMQEEIIKMYEEDVLPYSSHIFMFPFRFDYIKNENTYKREHEFYKDEPIDERIDIKELLNKLDKGEEWKYHAFNLDSVIEKKEVKYYNEFSYFYDYAKEALYNLSSFPADDNKIFYNNEISYYFEHKSFSKDKKNNRLKINYKKCDLNACYNLQIDGVSLRVFQTGIAVLSLEIENYAYHKLEDIKNINDFGRRFYPQYLNNDKGVISTPDLMAKSIEIVNTSCTIKENFMTSDICIQGTNQIKIGKHITGLLGESFTQNLKTVNSFYIQPIMDDRMYVMCWYGNNDFVDEIQKNEAYANSSNWYEYVFIDKHNDATVQNDWMKNELLYNATYDRWSGWKTFYGVTRYSFVALTDEKDFGKKTIRVHINTMYFQMMLLLLVTRASILRFSDEISAIATLNDTYGAERLSSLYEKYLRFYNRIYFKEVTHQDQGIELYDMALKQMKIVEHMEKLDQKFTKLFEYARLKEEEKQNQIKEKENEIKERFNSQLSILGAVFILPSLMLGLLSMSIFDYAGVEHSIWWVIIPLLFSVFAGLSFIQKGIWNKLLGVSLFFISLLFVYYNINTLHDKSPQKAQVIQTIYKTEASQHKGEN